MIAKPKPKAIQTVPIGRRVLPIGPLGYDALVARRVQAQHEREQRHRAELQKEREEKARIREEQDRERRASVIQLRLAETEASRAREGKPAVLEKTRKQIEQTVERKYQKWCAAGGTGYFPVYDEINRVESELGLRAVAPSPKNTNLADNLQLGPPRQEGFMLPGQGEANETQRQTPPPGVYTFQDRVREREAFRKRLVELGLDTTILIPPCG